MQTCTYDSGFTTDCVPLCSRPVTHVLRYRPSCSGWHDLPLCRKHLGPMQGRVYPDDIEVLPIGERA